ncbi:MAG TPA: Gfo/Idh/MocA family oxidoreductase [Bryobacteraceae bacterium]|nr:Gfo/Idh/MocA family oxidoreductase [Bryobacteraceae bacterium]
MNRRRWLFAAGSAVTAGRVRGSNERVNVGLIGCGGRGRFVAGLMKKTPKVEFTAVADVYLANAERAREWAGPEAKAYQDFRRLLEHKELDAVLVATPDHWHALATIFACHAGKHVYVEKPLAHNVREGRAMVDAAHRANRLVQAGTQQRSAEHFREVSEIIRSGQLGAVHFVRIWNYFNLSPDGIGRAADGEPPADLDWDMYCGAAPKVPYNPLRHLGTYRYFWDYSGGMITDYGTHRFDTVHQIMGVDSPRTVSASGGRFALRDAGEVPDVLQVTYEYAGFVLSYEMCMISGHGLGGRSAGMRYYNAHGPLDRPHGIAFYGTNGALFCDRIGYEIFPDLKKGSSTDFRMERRAKNTVDATPLHAANFIDAIRGLKPLASPVDIGHCSTTVPHLGNIAFKTGRKLVWNAQKEEIENDREASRLLSRQARAPWQLPVL